MILFSIDNIYDSRTWFFWRWNLSIFGHKNHIDYNPLDFREKTQHLAKFISNKIFWIFDPNQSGSVTFGDHF